MSNSSASEDVVESDWIFLTCVKGATGISAKTIDAISEKVLPSIL